MQELQPSRPLPSKQVKWFGMRWFAHRFLWRDHQAAAHYPRAPWVQNSTGSFEASTLTRHPSRKKVISSCPDDGPLCLQRCASPALTSLLPSTTGREQKLSVRSVDWPTAGRSACIHMTQEHERERVFSEECVKATPKTNIQRAIGSIDRSMMRTNSWLILAASRQNESRVTKQT